MQEIFYEESCELQRFGNARTKYTIMTVMMIASFLASFVFFFLLLIGPIDQPIFLIIIALFAVGFLTTALIYKNKRENNYLDFDYTFITGSVRIASVIRKKRRTGFISFESEDVICLGKFGSGTYDRYAASPDVKTLFATLNDVPAEGRDFYYIYVDAPTYKESRKNKAFKKKLIVLECSETFMAHVNSFAPHGTLEKDFQ